MLAPLVNTPFFFDLGEPDLAVWKKLFKGNQYAHQDRIMASPSFQGSKLQKLLGIEAPEHEEEEVDDGFEEVDVDADVPDMSDDTPEHQAVDAEEELY